MNETWYERESITYIEVRQLLINCLKFKLVNRELLDQIITSMVKSTTDFGSYRGYHTFLHADYKKRIIDRYNILTN